MSILPPDDPRSQVPLENYSAALDEIYILRAILADEADIISAHLDLKTFPKSRRSIAAASVERMRLAARGDFYAAMRKIWFPKVALDNAGADDTLTRHAWETQRGLRGDA